MSADGFELRDRRALIVDDVERRPGRGGPREELGETGRHGVVEIGIRVDQDLLAVGRHAVEVGEARVQERARLLRGCSGERRDDRSRAAGDELDVLVALPAVDVGVGDPEDTDREGLRVVAHRHAAEVDLFDGRELAAATCERCRRDGQLRGAVELRSLTKTASTVGSVGQGARNATNRPSCDIDGPKESVPPVGKFGAGEIRTFVPASGNAPEGRPDPARSRSPWRRPSPRRRSRSGPRALGARGPALQHPQAARHKRIVGRTTRSGKALARIGSF